MEHGEHGPFTDESFDFSYNAKSNLKKYIISQENYEGDFGTKPVLKATTEGNDRFYVMALEDVALDGTNTANRNSVYWNWYYNANENLDSSMNKKDANDFGQGKNKTLIMITKWNEEAYGTKNGDSSHKDLWGIFNNTNNTMGTVDENKWFVPSRDEWIAFGSNLGITTSNHGNFDLSDHYWTSSQFSIFGVYSVHYNYCSIDHTDVRNIAYVRLSAVF